MNGADARPPSKRERVLAALIERPHTSRELEQAPVFDHVAHSTAAELRGLGVAIAAERVELRGYAGRPAYVARYSIRADTLDHARGLLARMRERRIRGSR